MNVRPATLNDLSQVRYIAHTTWDDTYSETIAVENRQNFLEQAYKPQNLMDSIDTPGHWFYVAESEEEIVGFGHFMRRYHPTEGRAELVRLYILPEYQGRGIGRAILRTGFIDLRRANIIRCTVSVQSSNHRARQFYERHGFVYRQNHGQFLGTQIITLVEYTRDLSDISRPPQET